VFCSRYYCTHEADAQLCLSDVDQYHYIDVMIDGADKVDKGRSCFKGGEACQLCEKVLAETADMCVLFFL
jgi:ribose 5-phosphate isomerase